MSQLQKRLRFESNDYYAYLNLDGSASSAQIKRHFRQLALQWHPDKHRDGNARAHATDVFQKISEAHETLTSTSLRQEYDGVWRQRFRGKQRIPDWARSAGTRAGSVDSARSLSCNRLDGRRGASVERDSRPSAASSKSQAQRTESPPRMPSPWERPRPTADAWAQRRESPPRMPSPWERERPPAQRERPQPDSVPQRPDLYATADAGPRPRRPVGEPFFEFGHSESLFEEVSRRAKEQQDLLRHMTRRQRENTTRISEQDGPPSPRMAERRSPEAAPKVSERRASAPEVSSSAPAPQAKKLVKRHSAFLASAEQVRQRNDNEERERQAAEARRRYEEKEKADRAARELQEAKEREEREAAEQQAREKVPSKPWDETLRETFQGMWDTSLQARWGGYSEEAATIEAEEEAPSSQSKSKAQRSSSPEPTWSTWDVTSQLWSGFGKSVAAAAERTAGNVQSGLLSTANTLYQPFKPSRRPQDVPKRLCPKCERPIRGGVGANFCGYCLTQFQPISG